MISDLVNALSKEAFHIAANNQGIHFGTPARRYLGAELLPVREVAQNSWVEEGIDFRTVLANTGTANAPTTLEDTAQMSRMQVNLGSMDIAAQLTDRDVDAINQKLTEAREADAIADILDWQHKTLVRPILDRMEKQRWEAIDDALILRQGANGYAEQVNMYNPDSHRISGGAVTDGGIDVIGLIFKQQQVLAGKGYKVSRIVTSSRLLSALLQHDSVRKAVGGLSLGTGGNLQIAGRASREALNSLLQSEGLPSVEVYDLTSHDRAGGVVKLKRDTAFTMIAETGREESLDGSALLGNTLGYTALGRTSGNAHAGIHTYVEYRDKKPRGLFGEAYAMAAPVVQSPEAISVINFTF